MRNNRIWAVLISLFTCSACGQTGHSYQSPAGYDLNKSTKLTMPHALKEISGISFRPGATENMYAIQDEDGKIFSWPKDQPASLKHIRFADHGDYEDIGFSGNYVVVLRSDGTLFTFPAAQLDQATAPQCQEWKSLLPEGEYESLYCSGNGDIFILCKNCDADKNLGTVSGYILRLDGNGQPLRRRDFRISNLQSIVPGKKANMKVSALAFNNASRQWFLLSAVHHLLLVTDENWKPLKAFPLDPELFAQPEGICFDKDHNLYISNEAAKTPAATVLKFLYHSKSK